MAEFEILRPAGLRMTVSYMKNNGFTFIELLVVMSLLIILAATSVIALTGFNKSSALGSAVLQVVGDLRLGQSKTIASEGESQWGIYFTTTTWPHQYTVFKGTSYALRDLNFDKVYKLSEDVEIGSLAELTDSQVVFERVSGELESSGSLTLEAQGDDSKSKTIYLEISGHVWSSFSAVDDSERLKDSRHVHFDYGLPIDTGPGVDKLVITFDAGPSQEIIISDNMQAGQIYWQGEIEVDGETQSLVIHTHRLNAPDTEFCIHRDRRYNTKAFNLDLDSDPAFSPNLIRYTDAGLMTPGNSGSAFNFIEQ